MTPNSKAAETVLRKQLNLIKKYIKSNCSRATAVQTFESDDQTSCRMIMSLKYALASLIEAQSKALATCILRHNETNQLILHRSFHELEKFRNYVAGDQV